MAVNKPDDDGERPWLQEYRAFGIPETLEPYPDVPVHQFLDDAADANPDSGICQHGRTVTYPEILADAERVASALASRGIEKGDRVATILPTSVQFVVVDAAVSIAGGVHVPNDFLDATEDLEYRLQKSDADVLVGHDEHEELVLELAGDVGIDDVILTAIDDYSANPPQHDPRNDVEWLPEVVGDAPRDPPEVGFDPADDVHTLMFTGGTTGRPKGVQLTHRNIVANVQQLTSMTGNLSLESATTLLAMPFYHAYGYISFHSQIESGGDVVLVDDARDVDQMSEVIETHDVRVVMGVPTQFLELLEEDVDRKLLALSGSAPLADEVRAEFESDHLGITQGYGLTEMSPTAHVDLRGMLESIGGETGDDDTFDHPSIGIPLPDTEVKLVDIDTDEEIPLREAVEEERSGELCLNGPQRMLGYLDQPDPFDEDGFLPTGDVAKIDPGGRFYIVDRIKNMVNVSGLKVYTEEVDDVLYELDSVRRPATIGVPDPERPGSERVKIYIEPENETEVTEAQVRRHLQDRVPDQAMPIDVVTLDELPQTDIGKIDKQRLKERHETETDA